jgi:hypothetical protein
MASKINAIKALGSLGLTAVYHSIMDRCLFCPVKTDSEATSWEIKTIILLQNDEKVVKLKGFMCGSVHSSIHSCHWQNIGFKLMEST